MQTDDIIHTNFPKEVHFTLQLSKRNSPSVMPAELLYVTAATDNNKQKKREGRAWAEHHGEECRDTLIFHHILDDLTRDAIWNEFFLGEKLSYFWKIVQLAGPNSKLS